MEIPVLPLRAIAFQLLFLLLAIAIEGTVLQRGLALIPRKAMQYAITLNLLTTVLGWLIFFTVEGLLPQPIQNELMEYIFFNRWSTQMALWGILAGFLTFFGSFLLKVFSYEQLNLLLLTQKEWDARQESQTNQRRLGPRMPQGRSGLTSQANVLLTANAYSYSAMMVLLVTRYLLLQQ